MRVGISISIPRDRNRINLVVFFVIYNCPLFCVLVSQNLTWIKYEFQLFVTLCIRFLCSVCDLCIRFFFLNGGQ